MANARCCSRPSCSSMHTQTNYLLNHLCLHLQGCLLHLLLTHTHTHTLLTHIHSLPARQVAAQQHCNGPVKSDREPRAQRAQPRQVGAPPSHPTDKTSKIDGSRAPPAPRRLLRTATATATAKHTPWPGAAQRQHCRRAAHCGHTAQMTVLERWWRGDCCASAAAGRPCGIQIARLGVENGRQIFSLLLRHLGERRQWAVTVGAAVAQCIHAWDGCECSAATGCCMCGAVTRASSSSSSRCCCCCCCCCCWWCLARVKVICHAAL